MRSVPGGSSQKVHITSSYPLARIRPRWGRRGSKLFNNVWAEASNTGNHEALLHLTLLLFIVVTMVVGAGVILIHYVVPEPLICCCCCCRLYYFTVYIFLCYCFIVTLSASVLLPVCVLLSPLEMVVMFLL